MGIKEETKSKMQQALTHFREELKNIRTGRANPGMLDKVQIEVYGSPMRLRDIANVTTPEPRQLLITPYDAKNSPSIAKAIEAANLGMTPIVDGNAVRLNVPQMDEAVRKEMVKLCKRKCEEAKVSVRNNRREGNEAVKKSDLPEDLQKRTEKEIQELTDKYCKEADEICKEKEAEVMAV